jgi:hypothetical protein
MLKEVTTDGVGAWWCNQPWWDCGAESTVAPVRCTIPMDCQPGWAGVRTSMPFCELMDIGVGGGDRDCKTVKFSGVMAARRYVRRGVVRYDWMSWGKWSVISDWRLEDVIADNEPPPGELGKDRCDTWAWNYVEEETAAGVEAIVDAEG